MKNGYDSLLSAAAATANSAYGDFSFYFLLSAFSVSNTPFHDFS